MSQMSYTEVDHGLLIGLQDTKEGIDGLSNGPKSGRPSELPEGIPIRIRKKLKERKQGWATQQYKMR